MIVGIAGRAGAGKDLLTFYVRLHLRALGVRTVRQALADELKEDAREDGWNGQKDDAGRFGLQRYGTELMRAKEPTYWIRRWYGKLQSTSGIASRELFIEHVRKSRIAFFVPDIRYANEADWAKANGLCVRISRIEPDQRKMPSRDPTILGHASETQADLDAWNQWDSQYAIATGDFEALWKSAGSLASMVLQATRSR